VSDRCDRPVSFSVADGTAVLGRTPAVLRVLLDGLPDAWLVCDEGPDTFTPIDNLGHLLHGERADWIPRARIILERRDEPRFEAFDRWAHRVEYLNHTPTDLLDQFAQLRRENLAALTAWHLSPADLALTGVHPTLGTVTLGQLLATWVAHDLGHLGQISRVMAKRYKGAVGPWRAFLPILDR
jgi:hypothetical protein